MQYACIALLVTLQCFVAIITSQKVTVCETINSYTNDNQQKCEGQTLFINGNPGQKGDAGEYIESSTSFPGSTGPSRSQGVKGEKGAAGAVGPPGQKGSKGEEGKKGEKGDSYTSQNADLRKYITEFVDEYFQNYTKSILQELRQPRWHNYLNGYQYRVTNTTLNWMDSRKRCEDEGGDLAAVGPRNDTTRKEILQLIQKYTGHVILWIGLYKTAPESNTYYWIESMESVSSMPTLASPFQNAEEQNCGTASTFDTETNFLQCDGTAMGLCERLIV